MKKTNEWISDATIVREDLTICSEEAKLVQLRDELRTFCIETCMILPEILREPFLEFLDYVEQEEWDYKDAIRFRNVVLRIIRILEPIHVQVNPKELDMVSWYMVGAFAESWKDKIEEVGDLWKSEHKFLLN